MFTDLILGTAGHIDHGKTSLIKMLTGVDTDRLPEEKKRGITIELGYAHLELPPYRLGIVDVPGHEKFVRQMLAGATGMDLAMLVIAGDDSIKQQTYEHLDILRLLNLSTGVIALTKCDLVNPDWLILVEEEIRQLVQGTFLEKAPIVRTSSKSGAGLDELKAALFEACEQASQSRTHVSDNQSQQAAPFRMAIDRAFSIAGYGTIVTGSVSSGVLRVGDQIEIQPGRELARVRGLQNHDTTTDSVHRGQRAAINLAGVSLEAIQRGHELAATGYLVPSELLTVRLQMLDRLKKPIKDRTRVRFHVGTAEVSGTIRLLESTELPAGEMAFAQVILNEPVVAVWSQPFVIRRESPVETIGGGVVLHPNAISIRQPPELELKMLRDLAGNEPLPRASAAIYFSNASHWQPAELSRTAGIVDIDATYEQLKSTGELVERPITPTRNAVFHRQQLEALAGQVTKTLTRLHQQHPLRFTHPRWELESEFSYLPYPQAVDLAIELLKQRKQIVVNIHSISMVGYGPKLSKNQQQLMEQLIESCRAAGLTAPSIAQLEATANKNKDSVKELLELASENGELIQISDDIFLHRETMEAVREQLLTAINASNGLTMSEIRQLLDTSRKYAIPLCEYLDRTGFTVRDGDKRRLGKSGSTQM